MLQRVYRMTVMTRVMHWLLALSVITCFVTGLYIAAPIILGGVGSGPATGMLMGNVRFVHYMCALLLDVAFIGWFYLFFFSMKHPFVRSLFPVRQRMCEATQMLKHYFTLRNKPHTGDPHVDPLNAYWFVIIHLLIFLQMITGFAILAPSYSHANSTLALWPWILGVSETISLAVLGTITIVRQVHHLAAFLIVTLAVIHIYLQIWRETFWTEGHIGVVIGGYKYIEKEES